jgi:hypothetical protein
MRMQEVLQEIEDKARSLLRESEPDTQRLLSELCADSCSELSRLSAFWISEKVSDAQYMILQGLGILGGQSHDVLVVIYKQKYYLVDASVWQFFPDSTSIFLGKFTDMREVLIYLKDTYGGDWSIAETLTADSFNEKDEWEKVVRMNMS